MKNFVDSWLELKSKNYRHADGSEVLNDLDRESIMGKIKEHLAIGIDPQDAARLAVQSHMDEADAQLKEIYRQVEQKGKR